MLSRATGFGRVFALAYALSFTRLSDSYNLANTTPNIIYNLVLGGALAATLIPVFVERFTTGDDDDAWESISAVVTVTTVVLLALTVGFLAWAPTIVRMYTFRLSGTAARDQAAVAGALLRMFAPQVLLYGAITLMTAVLNVRRRFTAPVAAPVLNNILVIAVLVTLPHVARGLSLAAVRNDGRTLLLLGLGTTAGVALQAIALLGAVRGTGHRIRFVWAPRHPAVLRVLRLSGWTTGYVMANQVALWVVLALANGRPGDVSAYQAAYMFFQLPFALVAVSVITVTTPDLARRWTVGDRDGFVRTTARSTGVIVFLLTPVAVAYVAIAGPLVAAILRHGAMSASAAQTTGDVVRALAFGLPAFGLYLFLMSVYQSMQDTRTMFVIYCAENLLNVVLAAMLYPFAGVEGLGLAFGLAYVGGAVVAAADLRRRIRTPLGLASVCTGIAASSATMAAVTVAVTVAAVAVADVSTAIGTTIGLVLGVIAYVAVARHLRMPELDAVRAVIAPLADRAVA